MSQPCTVLIGAPDLLPVLKKRTGDGTSEMLVFSDADSLRALEVITKRRPRLVALERLFAATPRGAALINRIKADPSLVQSEIRVVSHDTDYSRVLPRPNGGVSASAGTGGAAAAAAAPPGTAVAVPVAPLDQRGTRRAPRFSMLAKVDVTVDGNIAALIDLSLVGAQVVAAGVLKPNQRVRMALSTRRGSCGSTGRSRGPSSRFRLAAAHVTARASTSSTPTRPPSRRTAHGTASKELSASAFSSLRSGSPHHPQFQDVVSDDGLVPLGTGGDDRRRHA